VLVISILLQDFTLRCFGVLYPSQLAPVRDPASCEGVHGRASVTLGADEAQGRVFFSAPKGDGWGSRGEEGLAVGTGHPQGNAPIL